MVRVRVRFSPLSVKFVSVLTLGNREMCLKCEKDRVNGRIRLTDAFFEKYMANLDVTRKLDLKPLIKLNGSNATICDSNLSFDRVDKSYRFSINLNTCGIQVKLARFNYQDYFSFSVRLTFSDQLRIPRINFRKLFSDKQIDNDITGTATGIRIHILSTYAD